MNLDSRRLWRSLTLNENEHYEVPSDLYDEMKKCSVYLSVLDLEDFLNEEEDASVLVKVLDNYYEWLEMRK